MKMKMKTTTNPRITAARRTRRTATELVLLGLVWSFSAGPSAAQERPAYENLRVLPKDITQEDLVDVMLENLRGLGLRRRANEGCLFCHVGSMERPSSEWDWASDDNPMKVKARIMMAMVRDINSGYLAKIERRSNTDVRCYTCHAARTNPMPLPEVLLRAYERGGIDALVRSYRELRTRYFGADAYDFRTPVLASVASTLAERGAVEEAAAIHHLNIEFSDDPRAYHGLVRLRMTETLTARGIDAMVQRYHELQAELPADAFGPLLLDGLAGSLFRSGREDAGFRLFELNYAEHPDAYVATEDLAWGNESIGNHERAIALAEAWLEKHPDHELGRRLLRDLEGR